MAQDMPPPPLIFEDGVPPPVIADAVWMGPPRPFQPQRHRAHPLPQEFYEQLFDPEFERALFDAWPPFVFLDRMRIHVEEDDDDNVDVHKIKFAAA